MKTPAVPKPLFPARAGRLSFCRDADSGQAAGGRRFLPAGPLAEALQGFLPDWKGMAGEGLRRFSPSGRGRTKEGHGANPCLSTPAGGKLPKIAPSRRWRRFLPCCGGKKTAAVLAELPRRAQDCRGFCRAAPKGKSTVRLSPGERAWPGKAAGSAYRAGQKRKGKTPAGKPRRRLLPR